MSSILAVLLALKIKHIDWLSLDLQGHEIPVLVSFPWRKVTVDLIVVECGNCKKIYTTKEKRSFFFPQFFEALGYKEVPKILKYDYFFVKNDFKPI